MWNFVTKTYESYFTGYTEQLVDTFDKYGENYLSEEAFESYNVAISSQYMHDQCKKFCEPEAYERLHDKYWEHLHPTMMENVMDWLNENPYTALAVSSGIVGVAVGTYAISAYKWWNKSPDVVTDNVEDKQVKVEKKEVKEVKVEKKEVKEVKVEKKEVKEVKVEKKPEAVEVMAQMLQEQESRLLAPIVVQKAVKKKPKSILFSSSSSSVDGQANDMVKVNLPQIMTWIRTYLRCANVKYRSAEHIALDLGVSEGVAEKLAKVRDKVYNAYKIHTLNVIAFDSEKSNSVVQTHFMGIFNNDIITKIKGDIMMNSSVAKKIQDCAILKERFEDRFEDRSKSKVSV